jgi:hypothetical protein
VWQDKKRSEQPSKSSGNFVIIGMCETILEADSVYPSAFYGDVLTHTVARQNVGGIDNFN